VRRRIHAGNEPVVAKPLRDKYDSFGRRRLQAASGRARVVPRRDLRSADPSEMKSCETRGQTVTLSRVESRVTVSGKHLAGIAASAAE